MTNYGHDGHDRRNRNEHDERSSDEMIDTALFILFVVSILICFGFYEYNQRMREKILTLEESNKMMYNKEQ